MHKHLIKWLHEIIEKEKGVPHTLTPFLIMQIIQKFIVMLQEEGC